jgi:hypothetical protein
LSDVWHLNFLRLFHSYLYATNSYYKYIPPFTAQDGTICRGSKEISGWNLGARWCHELWMGVEPCPLKGTTRSCDNYHISNFNPSPDCNLHRCGFLKHLKLGDPQNHRFQYVSILQLPSIAYFWMIGVPLLQETSIFAPGCHHFSKTWRQAGTGGFWAPQFMVQTPFVLYASEDKGLWSNTSNAEPCKNIKFIQIFDHHWDGLREILSENPIFHWKLRVDFPLYKQIQWNWFPPFAAAKAPGTEAAW